MGGVMRFVNELLRGLNSKGMNVNVLIGRQNKGTLGNFLNIWKEYVKSLQKVDVVHFIVLSPYNIPFIILAKIYGKKIVSTYHGNYLEESSLIREPHIFIPFWISDKIYRRCSNVIVSPNSYLIQKLNISSKSLVISNPLDPQISDTRLSSNLEKSNWEITLVTASNFDIKKKSDALQLVLDAMSFVEKKFDSVRLLVFGDGMNLDILKTKYDKKRNITFMGFRQDFRSFLLDSDAYVHISGLDVQPYAIIEAMMLGKVILCNNIGSLVETIDPDNNYVVSSDSSSIAKGILLLIDDIMNKNASFKDKEERNRRFAIDRYSTEVITTKYIELYRNILKSV
jgi:glycosyltransferase involved in cell wall biosynthesis